MASRQDWRHSSKTGAPPETIRPPQFSRQSLRRASETRDKRIFCTAAETHFHCCFFFVSSLSSRFELLFIIVPILQVNF